MSDEQTNKDNEVTKSCCHKRNDASKEPQADSNTRSSSNIDSAQEATTYHLMIEGASCASCVSKIEKALRAVYGVTKAEMNFAQRTVSVTGKVKDAALVTAIEIAGYQAKVDTSDSEQEALDEKDKADWAYYKKLMRDMTIAASDRGNDGQHN
jgi:Cu+-exporting ATPase